MLLGGRHCSGILSQSLTLSPDMATAVENPVQLAQRASQSYIDKFDAYYDHVQKYSVPPVPSKAIAVEYGPYLPNMLRTHATVFNPHHAWHCAGTPSKGRSSP